MGVSALDEKLDIRDLCGPYRPGRRRFQMLFLLTLMPVVPGQQSQIPMPEQLGDCRRVGAAGVHTSPLLGKHNANR
jgi:hypothetical protein